MLQGLESLTLYDILLDCRVYELLVPEPEVKTNNGERKKSVHDIDDIVKLLLDVYQPCLKRYELAHELPYWTQRWACMQCIGMWSLDVHAWA